MNLNEIFSKSVRVTRENLGISQESLAEKSGLHRTYISLIERGKRNVTLANVEKIASGLGIEAFQLIREDYLNDAIKKSGNKI